MKSDHLRSTTAQADSDTGCAPLLSVAPDVIRALLCAGFYAVQCGRAREATSILGFVAALRPHHEFSAIGSALAALCDGRYDDAHAVLVEAAQRMPGNQCITAFQVLALMLAGRVAEARKLHAQLQKNASADAKVGLVQALDDELTRRATPLNGLR